MKQISAASRFIHSSGISFQSMIKLKEPDILKIIKLTLQVQKDMEIQQFLHYKDF